MFQPPRPTDHLFLLEDADWSAIQKQLLTHQKMYIANVLVWWGGVLVDFVVLKKSSEPIFSKYMNLILFVRPFVTLIILHAASCDNTPATGSPESHSIIHRASLSIFFFSFFL